MFGHGALRVCSTEIGELVEFDVQVLVGLGLGMFVQLLWMFGVRREWVGRVLARYWQCMSAIRWSLSQCLYCLAAREGLVVCVCVGGGRGHLY